MAFMDHFGDLSDPRSHVNKRHDLHDILFLVVVAILSGAEGWKDITDVDHWRIEVRHYR